MGKWHLCLLEGGNSRIGVDQSSEGSLYGVVANMLDFNIVVNMFKT